MRKLTRRTFLGAALAATATLLTACSSPAATQSMAASSESPTTSAGADDVIGGVATDDTTASRPDASATQATAEEEGKVKSRKGVRELVEMEPPDNSGVDYNHVVPDPSTVQGTVLMAQVTPHEQQVLYLWEEGNAPAKTTSARGGYDPADFRPTVTSVPAASGTSIKGAVLLCAGGAFAIRGDNSDCYPTANALSARGYQCFVVDYRLQPYTQQESALDLARAIRFVRAHWQEFGLPDENCIAVGGYSAGGILCGETILNWSGTRSPQDLDSSYVPDELDAISADVTAGAMIYSFYGRLAWAEKSARVLRDGNCPPTYYCYGTRDPFYDQFEGQVELMKDIGYTVRARVLDGWPHGFGAEGGWVPEFDQFMQEAFSAGRQR